MYLKLVPVLNYRLVCTENITNIKNVVSGKDQLLNLLYSKCILYFAMFWFSV